MHPDAALHGAARPKQPNELEHCCTEKRLARCRSAGWERQGAVKGAERSRGPVYLRNEKRATPGALIALDLYILVVIFAVTLWVLEDVVGGE